MEIKWLGWSCFRLKTSGKTIFFDPVLEDSEKAELVLISHGHSDHSDLNMLSKIRKPETVVLTSVQNQSSIKGKGMAPGDTYKYDSIQITACHAYNLVRSSRPGSPFHPRGYGVGWIMESEGKRVYHLGDTEFIPEMNNIKNIDLMLVPISGVYVMDVDEAVKAVTLVRPRVVIPMHFGIIDIPGENPTHYHLEANPHVFAEKLMGISETRVMAPGDSWVLQ